MVFGSSPPSIFVGKYGYPKVVRFGFALPPLVGDTTIYDKPEMWSELPIEKILELRFSLIFGQFTSDVRRSLKEVELIKEISLYTKPVDMEVIFNKTPEPRTTLDDLHTPIGPSAPAKSVKICSTPSVHKIIERVYDDTDLRAVDAMKLLYKKGIEVSQIQKMLSAGSLGKKRRLVPTRWAITAVDDTISKCLIKNVKHYETIDEYRVFVLKEMRNLFIAILCPARWSFEWGEAWFPDTIWNKGEEVVVITDSESFYGRQNYATLGGCYYSARLATAEYLERERRQATAILWREIYSGFKVPVGVWFVRERLRKMFSKPYMKFDTIEEVVEYIAIFSKLGVERWIKDSRMIDVWRQKTIWEFV